MLYSIPDDTKTLEIFVFDHRNSIDDGMERENRVRDALNRFIYSGGKSCNGDETTECNRMKNSYQPENKN